MAQIRLNPGVPEINSPEFADFLVRWHAEYNSPEAMAERAQAVQPEPITAYVRETCFKLTAAGQACLAELTDDEDGGELLPIDEMAEPALA